MNGIVASNIPAWQGAERNQPTQSDAMEFISSQFNGLFRQLCQIFPGFRATVKTQDDLNEMRRQWVLAMLEGGIRTREQIDAGLKVARQVESDFLPSCGKFVAWCQQGNPQRAGLPTAEQLYSELMNYCKRRGDYASAEEYPWKSAAQYWLVIDLYDAMRLNRMTDSEVRKKAELLLKDMIKRIELGEVIPPPVKRIAPPTHPSGPTPAELLYAKCQQRQGDLLMSNRSGQPFRNRF